MLIISKFIDYYDKVGAQFGVDKSIVYQRKEICNPSEWRKRDNPHIETINKKDLYAIQDQFKTVFRYESFSPNCGEMQFPTTTPWEEHHTWWLVYFCGQPYIVLELQVSGHYEGTNYVNSGSTWIHEPGIIEILQEKAKEPQKRKPKYGRRSDNEWLETLSLIEKIKGLDFSKFLFEKKVPVFAYRISGSIWSDETGGLILNPKLANWEFWKVKDPFTAFQEIQQYISGVIGTGGNEPVATDDKYKILSHGFDLKTSFRKDPGKPKPRKAKGK